MRNKLRTSIIALFIGSISAFAQLNDIQPGIYTIVDGKPILLKQTFGGTSSGDSDVVGFDVGHQVYKYKGETSGVNATDTFILVVNPKEKNTTHPLHRKMNPKHIILVQLSFNQVTGHRYYEAGTSVQGYTNDKKNWLPFEYKKLDKGTFEIKASGLQPGEYAFISRSGNLCPFNYSRILGFTIPELTK